MVAREEDLRDRPPAEAGRPRVVRVVETRALERILLRRALVAENPRDEPYGCLDHRHGGKFAPGEDEIAHRDRLQVQLLVDALVQALVTAADEKHPIFASELAGPRLAELLAARTQDETPKRAVTALQPLHAVDEGLRLQDHSGPTPVGAVVHRPVAVPSEVPEVDQEDPSEPAIPGQAQDAGTRVRLQSLRKEGEDGKERHGALREKAQKRSSGPSDRQPRALEASTPAP